MNIPAFLDSEMRTILALEYGGNTVMGYLIAFLVFILTMAFVKVFKDFIIMRFRILTERTKTDLDDLIVDIIASVGWPFYIIIGLYVSLQFITVPPFITNIVGYAALIIAAYYVIMAGQRLVDYGKEKILSERKERDTAIVDLMAKILKVSLWAIVVIVILSNLGFEISTLVAGMGITGIAVALAVQNILGDVFASFSIYFDKPFIVGDFIVIGEDSGVVRKIGIKTTRIETLQGEELVVPNKELTEIRIHNYGRMKKRRVVFSFGVTYDTELKKLRKIPSIIKDIMKGIKLAQLDRVHFKEFGDFSLNYQVVYYVLTRDYKKYMDTQQRINLEILKRFKKEGIQMAYPTQTIFLHHT